MTSQPSQRMHEVIDADLAQVARLGQAVHLTCLSIGLSSQAADEVELSVCEGVNNAIRHAYSNKGVGKVEVTVSALNAGVLVEVADYGRTMPAAVLEAAAPIEFDPSVASSVPEGGMGLSILKQLMTEVRYHHQDGRNVLSLVRVTVPPPSEAQMPKHAAVRQVPTDDAAVALKHDVLYHLKYTLGRHPGTATQEDLLHALALASRRQVVDGLQATETRHGNAKRVAYLSMEFLVGRALENNLVNLGLRELAREVVSDLGVRLEEVAEHEHDAALGNGGLGRLAACFLDSLATLDLPATGYGINYEYGLFRQEIDNGEQREQPDHWFAARSPWLIERADESILIPVYGRVSHEHDGEGRYNPMWLGWRLIVGVPHDFPVVGYGGKTVNALRLFSARGSDEFDMRVFNAGDYIEAVRQKVSAETISKVLYPADEAPQGRELRLLQEYFLVACSVRDIIRRFKATGESFSRFSDRYAMQLNDTHPALTVAELMRVLIDEENLPWEEAWRITTASLAYTNHTLLAEALERWPMPLLEYVLPRHTQLICEINRRFLETVEARWPGDDGRKRRMSIIEECEPQQVRMAHLSIIGGHSVNGVAALHSELVKSQLLPDFYELWPEKFNNKTNGVTQRRWLLLANPELAALLTSVVGPGWITDLSRLRAVERLCDDSTFQARVLGIKQRNKTTLAGIIETQLGITVDPSSMFDVQVKRIHEYKRQLLNIMHVIHLYLRIVEDGVVLPGPRTCVFAGKAAPGYFLAKRIIHLINAVGEVVNNDPRVRGQLKVAFLPDYRVSLAERIIPAADLSEQISTAGKEASGTGNMKLALNGALTIGTLDGANIEIKEEVGDENIFIFGLTAAEVDAVHRGGRHDSRALCAADADLNRVIAAIGSGRFAPKHPGAFSAIVDRLLNHDEYLHTADFRSYVEAQERAANTYADRTSWGRKSILNIARVGKFSSDRTIIEYADEIWGLRRSK